MADLKDLPSGEFEVMEVLWKKKRATTKDVQEELSKARPLAYTTVATLLSRLKDKGYVTVDEEGPAHTFQPAVQRDKVIRRKLDDLVNKVLGGSIAPLAAYMAENKKLSAKQVKALEQIVKDEKDKNKEKKKKES